MRRSKDGGLRAAIAFACAYLVKMLAFRRAAPGGLSNRARVART
jgi:hypothetical protein